MIAQTEKKHYTIEEYLEFALSSAERHEYSDSPSETLCERDEKFAAYRTIPPFQEYLLIDQSVPHVEQYSKTEAQKWLFSEYNALDSRLVLSSIPFEITLADLYEGLELKTN